MKVIYHPAYLDHAGPGYHPESPERLIGIKKRLDDLGFQEYHEPGPAVIADLLLAHDENYIRYVETVKGGLDIDTYVNKHSFQSALLSAGGALEASRTAWNGEDSFALLRPPGHHAGHSFGGGFCLFNNIAVAAMEHRKFDRKVIILDVDAHHGNGTQDIFKDDPGTVYMSVHQWGIFPGTGHHEDTGGKGKIVNVPLPQGSGDETYRQVMERLWYPIIDQFKPDIALISLGADCHYMDPLTGLVLTSKGIVDMVQGLMDRCRNVTEKGVAVMLEGGYNIEALSEVYGALVMDETTYKFTSDFDTKCTGIKELEEAISHQSRFWDL